MNEKEKYEMMYAKCARYGKDWQRAGRVHKLLIEQHIPPLQGVWDFGAGNGTCVEWLRSTGRTAIGVDIVGNVADRAPGVQQGDLRDPDIVLFPRANGVCIDVMEHIPTEDVPTVISNIAGAVTGKVYFHIALGPDKDGEELGVELHLTQKPTDWWVKELSVRFSEVRIVNECADRFVAFICTK